MVELDYAYLADYAAVQGGKLTAVGASYTHMSVRRLGVPYTLYVAGRVRATADLTEVPMNLAITPPEGSYHLAVDSVLRKPPGTRPYDGKIGILFAMSTVIALVEEGVYRVEISLDGHLARVLAFELEVGQET